MTPKQETAALKRKVAEKIDMRPHFRKQMLKDYGPEAAAAFDRAQTKHAKNAVAVPAIVVAQRKVADKPSGWQQLAEDYEDTIRVLQRRIRILESDRMFARSLLLPGQIKVYKKAMRYTDKPSMHTYNVLERACARARKGTK